MLLSTCFRFAGPDPHWRTVFALITAVLCHTSAVAAPSEIAPRLEYQVKAGYLFNFLRFTEWPPEMQRAGTPFRVGIVEDVAAFNVISEALKGKTLEQRKIVVEALPTGASFDGFHLIFVPRSARLPEVEAPLRGVLLVGETKDFALRSGTIGFVLRGHNIRFQVNLTAAQHAGLKPSGRLASLAEIVPAKAQ